MSAKHLQVAYELVDQLLESGGLSIAPPSPCPYLSERESRLQGFVIRELPPDIYQALMDRGFRRSGSLIYRPQCPDCQECRQLRIRVRDFAPSRSQKRVWRKNVDLNVSISTDPTPTDEKWDLFRAYQEHQHDGTMITQEEDFVAFLYDSPVPTIELQYRLGGRLLGVSIVDRCPISMSSVYMYFDPDHGHRSLGTHSVLWEVDYCRGRGIEYYYLGYYVAGSESMAYKSNFNPHDILEGQSEWRRGGC